MTRAISPLIHTVLFDADGVVQHTPTTISSQLRALLGAERATSAADFAAEIFAAEKPALVGRNDFREDLVPLFEKWQIDTNIDDALAMWHAIEVIEPVREVIVRLRATGIECHLASNQNAVRARFMTEELGYGRLFGRRFYSCDLGFVKPNARYFRRVVDALEIAVERVLFIDDKRTNVLAAREVGMHAEQFEWSPKRQNAEQLESLLGQYRLEPRT